MIARKITLTEKADASAIQSICFMFPEDIEKLRETARETPEKVDYQNTWGCFDDDGKMIAAIDNSQFSVHYDGHVVGAGGIGGVATLPEGRMRGAIRMLMRAILEDDYRNGKVFSVLYPFSHAYYRQYGYDICLEARCIKFPSKALAGYKQTAQARQHLPEMGNAPFQRVYDRFAARYNLATVRGDEQWRSALRGDAQKAQSYKYLLSRDGEDIAYAVLRPRRVAEFQILMRVEDMAFVDRDALHTLLGFLHKLSAQCEHFWMEVPGDFELSALIDEAYDVEIESLSRKMARVVNVPEALRMMRHPAGVGTYTVRVTDDFLAENDGAYRVTYGPEGVRVEKGEFAACDLDVTVQTLAQLCLGYLSLDMAALKKGVTVRNARALEGVFVWKPGYHVDRY